MSRYSVLAGILLAGFGGPLGAAELDELLAQSRDSGRPLLVVISTPGCGPCRALKAVLQNDPGIRSQLERCIYRAWDASHPEFQQLRQRYPGPFTGVPMVYLIGSNGQLRYARSGALTAPQLSQLLTSALPSVATDNTDRLADRDAILATTQRMAERGDLIGALKAIGPIADLPGEGEAVATARSYRDQLLDGIAMWLNDLRGRMERSELPHGTAYRIAELYAQLPPEYQQARADAWQLLRRFEDQPETRVAVLQAKQLVQGQMDEREQAWAAAVRSYEQVLALDPGSPAAQYARQRLARVRR